MRHAIVTVIPVPTAPDTIGWCPRCGTYQRRRDGRMLNSIASLGLTELHCMRCDDQPWRTALFVLNPRAVPCVVEHADAHVSDFEQCFWALDGQSLSCRLRRR